MRFDRRKRREFITLLGGAAVSSASWPSLVRAQSAKAARVGFLGLVSALKSCAACGRVGEGLRDLGWIEGRNLIIEFRWAEGRTGALCREISLFSPCRRGRAHRHSGRMILIAGRVHHPCVHRRIARRPSVMRAIEDGRYGALEIGRPIPAPMLLWPKPLDLRLERGFDRPVRRLNGDHARPGIGDTASLTDALDLRTLLPDSFPVWFRAG
jgi:hypothetical protein